VNDEKVLIVEDDVHFARFLMAYLIKQGFDAETVETGAGMFEKLESKSYDCLIVDLTLPDEDGIVLVRKLRARSSSPVIVLTGRESIDDKLASFDVGADDYVVKPVDPREMVMRINAVIARAVTSDQMPKTQLKFGDYVLDHARHEAREDGGAPVDFTPAEFALIWILAQANGEVLSRDKLIDAVSSGDGPASARAVDILISRVRKKLAKEAVITVAGSGYRAGWQVSADI
jgi:DNA-binding response OmpR family regulator